MSYLTVEVEIDHGRIVPREPEKLPEKGRGLLTVLRAESADPSASPGRLPVGDIKLSQQIALRPVGLAKGEFAVPDDFNASLPDDVLLGFEGR